MRPAAANTLLLTVAVMCATACDKPSPATLPVGTATQSVRLDQPAASDDSDATTEATITSGAAVARTVDDAYFTQQYKEDATNHTFQTQDEYLRWVREFYEAKATLLTPSGWNEQSEELLAKIEASDGRAQAQALLADLGKRIAAEWAKEKRASKLDPIADLLRWGTELKEAAVADDGSGEKVLQALRRVDEQVRTVLDNQ